MEQISCGTVSGALAGLGQGAEQGLTLRMMPSLNTMLVRADATRKTRGSTQPQVTKMPHGWGSSREAGDLEAGDVVNREQGEERL